MHVPASRSHNVSGSTRLTSHLTLHLGFEFRQILLVTSLVAVTTTKYPIKVGEGRRGDSLFSPACTYLPTRLLEPTSTDDQLKQLASRD